MRQTSTWHLPGQQPALATSTGVETCHTRAKLHPAPTTSCGEGTGEAEGPAHHPSPIFRVRKKREAKTTRVASPPPISLFPLTGTGFRVRRPGLPSVGSPAGLCAESALWAQECELSTRRPDGPTATRLIYNSIFGASGCASQGPLSAWDEAH